MKTNSLAFTFVTLSMSFATAEFRFTKPTPNHNEAVETAGNEIISNLLKRAVPARKLSGSGDGSGSGSGSGSGDENEENGGGGAIASFSFDATAYSLKYTRCQTIKEYTYTGYNNYYYKYGSGVDQIFSNKKFAVFRLCPSGSCQSNAQYGCNEGYGEYMVELGDYLTAMQDYRDAKEEALCDYCDGLYGDDGYSSECSVCNDDGYGNQKNAVENYLSCTQVIGYDANGDWARLFVGPTCDTGSDSYSLKMGLFYDKKCSTPATDFSISEFTEGDVYENSLTTKYYSTDCISCNAANMAYSNQNNDDGYNNVLDLCNDLYYYSAKCESRISLQYSSSNSYNNGYSSSTISEESKEKACSYIENVARGSFDEEGTIYLNAKSYSKQQSYHSSPDVKVTGAQAFWLSFFIIGSTGLAACAIYITRTINNANKTVEMLYSSGQVA